MSTWTYLTNSRWPEEFDSWFEHLSGWSSSGDGKPRFITWGEDEPNPTMITLARVGQLELAVWFHHGDASPLGWAYRNVDAG